MMLKFSFEFWITNCDNIIVYISSLSWNKIEDAGAQALAEGLQHYTNLQVLE